MVIDSGPQLTASFHRLLLLASFATIVAGAAILGRRYRGIDELNNVRNLPPRPEYVTLPLAPFPAFLPSLHFAAHR